MPLFILDILSNVIANLIFWLSGGLLVASLVGRKRRRLREFFGLVKNNRLFVYMSSRPVYKPFEERGVQIEEFQLIPLISSLFLLNKNRLIPEAFSGLVDTFWLIQNPKVEFLPSPRDSDEIQFANTICVGGPAYNVATLYYSKTNSPYSVLLYENDKWRIEIQKGTKAGKTIFADEGQDIAILNKCFDVENETTIFIVGGAGINGTRAAAEYLIKNWQSLQKIYGEKEFCICLKCPYRTKNNLTGYEQAEVIMRLP